MTNDLAIKILTGDVLGTTEQTHEAVAMAVKALSALPSAQPERHGRWLDGNRNQPCSVCKYRGKKSWNYCPNCGARMDGE